MELNKELKPAVKHTPGRLVLANVGIGKGNARHLILREGFASATDWIAHIPVRDAGTAANAERIVDCWNACEGLVDPSVVPELVIGLRAVALTFRQILRGDMMAKITHAELGDIENLIARAGSGRK